MFRERFRTNTTAHWLARLEAQDLLCAPVRDMREALVDPQTLHNEMILEGHDGEQAMRFVASPIRMSAPVGMRRAPPRLGEHTDEVLAEARALRAATTQRDERPARSARARRHVTLDRPAVMNAIDLATEAELQRIWTAIEPTATSAPSCSPAPATARSASAPT